MFSNFYSVKLKCYKSSCSNLVVKRHPLLLNLQSFLSRVWSLVSQKPILVFWVGVASSTESRSSDTEKLDMDMDMVIDPLDPFIIARLALEPYGLNFLVGSVCSTLFIESSGRDSNWSLSGFLPAFGFLVLFAFLIPKIINDNALAISYFHYMIEWRIRKNYGCSFSMWLQQ